MKNITKEKASEMLREVRGTFKELYRNLKEIYNKEITSDEDVKRMISDNPSVETLFKLNHYTINNIKGYNMDDDYFLYDTANFDDSDSYAIRDRVLKNIFNKLGLTGTIVYRVGFSDGEHLRSEYFFTVSRGRNGSGDFVNVDMKEIADIINIMRDNGATNATPIDVFIDAPDDLSDWVIGFMIDEEND